MDYFPPIEPYQVHRLQVSELHNIYVEESGNPNGKPVVFLHGGPGGGTDPLYRRMFNPAKYRIVMFDQRGCGRSEPFAELRENNTWALVEDIEKIRVHLGIERWVVFGGSWGSTLSLSYAQAHPERVKGLILRGIFMCRPSELQWFYQAGASHIYPEPFAEYIKVIPAAERGDLIKAFYQRLTSEDDAVRLEAAKAWSVWEGSTSKLIPDLAVAKRFGNARFAEAFARIECHYFVNSAFMDPPDQLLRNVAVIRKIPGVIVHGRYDVVCPVKSAYELSQAWPEAELHIVPDAGHSMTEPGIRDLLLDATERFAAL